MTTKIYALICPFTDTIKYIGKANNPERRLRDHMYDVRDMDAEKALWVRQMKAQKKKPSLEILDEVSIGEWEFWE